MKNAIILCSGGLDSVVTTNYVKKKLEYDNLIVLFFNYGQRTLKQERKASQKCARGVGGLFREIKLPELAKISTSMINKKVKAKKISLSELKDTKAESLNWYVPCRNTIFLTYALAIAEARFVKSKGKQIWDIFTGFKNEGQEAYPDTTPEFVGEMNKLSKISSNTKTKILAPMIKKDKEEIIKLGRELGVKFQDTYTCYVGAGKKHCGYCLSCRLRQEGFYWAGIKDFTRYGVKLKDYRTTKPDTSPYHTKL